MKNIEDYNFSGKNVLVRCDFNVPMENGRVLDNFRIKKSLKTIRFLQKQGAKVILISHLGRPSDSDKDRKNFSLKPIVSELENLLGNKVEFSKKIVGRKPLSKINKLDPGGVIILENLRFEKGEEENSRDFAEKLSKLGDSYVNEAFGVSHRAHASIDSLPRILPSFAGIELQGEVKALARILNDPGRPLVAIVGGAKIESKLKAANEILEFADHLILGGKLVSQILRVKGIIVGRTWPNEEAVRTIKDIELTNSKLHMPVDVLVSPDISGEMYIRESGPGGVRKDEDIYDIGSESIKTFSEIIKSAKTIFWSGPLGVFENDKFEKGTKEIAMAIADNKKAFSVVGGGETVKAVRKFNMLHEFSFISSGGGAMLHFISGEKMPGLEVLEK